MKTNTSLAPLTDLTLGSNIVKTNGSFGKKGDRLNLNITAPDLSRFGFGLGGLLNARGYISGSFSDGLKTLEADLNGEHATSKSPMPSTSAPSTSSSKVRPIPTVR